MRGRAEGLCWARGRSTGLLVWIGGGQTTARNCGYTSGSWLLLGKAEAKLITFYMPGTHTLPQKRTKKQKGAGSSLVIVSWMWLDDSMLHESTDIMQKLLFWISVARIIKQSGLLDFSKAFKILKYNDFSPCFLKPLTYFIYKLKLTNNAMITFSTFSNATWILAPMAAHAGPAGIASTAPVVPATQETCAKVSPAPQKVINLIRRPSAWTAENMFPLVAIYEFTFPFIFYFFCHCPRNFPALTFLFPASCRWVCGGDRR